MPADRLKELREGVAAAMSGIPDVQVSARWLTNPTPPAVHVFPGEIDWHAAMGNGHHNWTLTVEAFAALVTDEGAQEVLDRMVADDGDYSVKAAIESDSTLGGLVEDVTVTRTYDYGLRLKADGTLVLGCKWDVEIMG